jgi:GNAT superfamily N-acetyltransferase
MPVYSARKLLKIGQYFSIWQGISTYSTQKRHFISNPQIFFNMPSSSSADLVIRYMGETDLPGVIQLQKESLGEGLIPRNEAFWKWKHEQNPFGKSPVLCAIDEGKIVALRAFMPWIWKLGDRVYHALRAVDTATHPDYQGKGLFKKLTLRLIDEMQAQNKDFIFNTPNEKSMPGYLKMGWQKVGKIPLRVGLGAWSGLTRNTLAYTPPPFDSIAEANEILLDQWMARQAPPSYIYTPKNAQFLKWRYQNIPGISYFGYFSEAEGGLLMVGRIKLTLGWRELRIVELYGSSSVLFNKVLNAWIDHFRPAFVSTPAKTAGGLQNKIGFGMQIGPILTLRKLNHLPEGSEKIGSWGGSLGDFELF